jgi:cytochrome P450
MSRNLDNYTHLNMTGGAALTDFYPILRSLPAWIMSSKRAALAHYDYENKMYTDIYRASKACERPCISTHVATQQLQDSASDEDVAYIPAQLWEAGSDTTSTELYAFIQALLLYPSVQVAGHAELDAVIGQDRMPTLDDISRLPYVRACVTECLRWLPTAVLGAFPHAAMKADLYRGFTIPKDAMVVLNAWTIHRDANVYPDPEVFDPTRFLNPPFSSSSKMDPPINSPDLYAFGAGRRVCPGSNLAEQSMVLAIARIFWAFDVKKVEDEVLRQDVFEQGFVAIPSKFGVVTRPRSEGKRGLVEREWSVAREGLREGQFEEGWGG